MSLLKPKYFIHDIETGYPCEVPEKVYFAYKESLGNIPT